MMPEEQKPYEVVPIKGMKPSKPVSPSEDKTAEQMLKAVMLRCTPENELKDFEEDFKNGIESDEGKKILEAMTEYGNLRWNKAIEEAVQCVFKNGFTDNENQTEFLISELNKLKK